MFWFKLYTKSVSNFTHFVFVVGPGSETQLQVGENVNSLIQFLNFAVYLWQTRYW